MLSTLNMEKILKDIYLSDPETAAECFSVCAAEGDEEACRMIVEGARERGVDLEGAVRKRMEGYDRLFAALTKDVRVGYGEVER